MKNPMRPAASISCLFLLGALPVGCGADRKLTFADRTAASGIDFECVCGGKDKDYILEVNGGGVALFDHDGDGDLDVFFVNGSRFDLKPESDGAKDAPSDRLYRNDGSWKFVDVTGPAGLRESAWGCGCAVA